MSSLQDPHAGLPVLTLGPRPENARIAMILAHGRGASAEDILGLAAELNLDDVAYLAPQAAGHTWYPYSFLSEISRNEPGLSSALRLIDSLVASVQRDGTDRVALLGFSQGACLALEYAARHARRYAAVVGLS